MTSFITAGTITLVNGDATVTGSGTAWAAPVKAGYLIGIYATAGLWIGEVLSVTDDTHLELTVNYPGTGESGRGYVIVPRDGALDFAVASAKLRQILEALDSGEWVAEGIAAVTPKTYLDDSDRLGGTDGEDSNALAAWTGQVARAQFGGLFRVRLVAASNVAISTGLEAGDSIDGVTLAAGDAVLLAAQSTTPL